MASRILLHGFAQTGACLGPIGAPAPAMTVVTPDLAGHGRGGPVEGDLWWGAEQLAALVAPLPRPRHLIGYSMGGRLALHLAVAHPDVIDRLTLIGATAGIDDAAGRAARIAEDEARATHLEAVGLRAFLEEWLALPLFAGLPDWARFEAERGTNTVAGLAASLRRWGTGTQEPLWDRLATLTVPTTVVAGELDTRFAALAHRLAGALPHGEARIVAGVGHAVHLEAPEAVLDLLA